MWRCSQLKAEKLFVQELRTQACFAIRCFDEFSRALECEDVDSVFYHAHHYLVHAASIDKMFATSSKKGHPCGTPLAKLLACSNMDLKHFRRLRNHLEHFDERLAAWVKEFPGYPIFDMNIVTGTVGFPARAFLRAMDGHIFKFQGEEYDLDSLNSEISKLLVAIDAIVS